MCWSHVRPWRHRSAVRLGCADHANDIEPRVNEVDRRGDFDGARDVLRSTARRIRMYAGQDPVLIGLMEQLMRESEMFHRVMAERSRKQHYAMSHRRLRSRDFEGKAVKRAS